MSAITELNQRIQALALDPEDHHLKIETLNLMKKVKILAEKGDKLAQYQLAQLFPRHSQPYLNWMHAAAKQGLTNALLDLSQDYISTGKAADIQKSASYIVAILASGDSYITDQAMELMTRNRLLAAEVNRQVSVGSIGTSAYGLFAADVKVLGTQTVESEDLIPSMPTA